MIIIVMGVSGSGKSTIGAALAERLNGEFLEGDTYHPAANIDKMRHGIALSDDDRAEWLDTLSGAISEKAGRKPGTPIVISCSALKKTYRARLRQADPELRLVYLAGSQELLARRMACRRNHFMPPQLLASQLATIDPPGAEERPIVVDVSRNVDEIIDDVSRQLAK